MRKFFCAQSNIVLWVSTLAIACHLVAQTAYSPKFIPTSIATGPTVPPPVDEDLRIATGPTLPPPVDEDLRIATGPTLPPPVDEDLRIATGPTLPPPVDEDLRIAVRSV